MISIIIPAFNEADGIEALHKRLTACAGTWNEAYELVIVDDGSADETLAICTRLAREDPHLRIVSFSRNFGHQAAVTAGLCYATGDIVAIIDADLQDPPEQLARFFAKCREGYDVVFAIRTKRKEGPLKRLAYFVYYRLLARLSNIDIPVDAGDFCVMSRRMVHALNALPERNRFVRGLRSWVGFRQTGLAYERDARHAGTSKYSFSKLLNLGLDGVINFSYRPLKLLSLLGMTIGAFALAAAVAVLYLYVTDTTIGGYNPRQTRGWTSLMLAILFFAGMHLFALGIVGEYIGRLFEETKHRPMYVVSRLLNFGPGVAVDGTPSPGRQPGERHVN